MFKSKLLLATVGACLSGRSQRISEEIKVILKIILGIGLRPRMIGLAALMLSAAAVHAGTIVLYTDPLYGSSGDGLDRGFYFSGFTGTNLYTVTLAYVTDTPGVYTTSLTANLGAYNGPIIGSTQTITTTLGFNDTLVTYNFGGVAVPLGSTVTFTQQVVSGAGGYVDYDTGTSGPTGVTETEETVAPLDIYRRSQVGVTITELDTSAVPEPSTVALLGAGLLGLVTLRQRTRKA
jgi:hypothetical protein